MVDESLPFQGLDNHTYYISQEGFSGARATYYNKYLFLKSISYLLHSPDKGGNPQNQKAMINSSYNQVNQPNDGILAYFNSSDFGPSRENLASRKSSSILRKQMNKNKLFNEDKGKPGKPMSSSTLVVDETAFNRFNRFGENPPKGNEKRLDNQLRSMPKIGNPKHAYTNNEDAVKNNLIQKFQGISSSEYEGGNDAHKVNPKGNLHSKSSSQGEFSLRTLLKILLCSIFE